MAVAPEDVLSTHSESDYARQRQTNKWLIVTVVVLALALGVVATLLVIELNTDSAATDEQGAFPTGTFVGERFPASIFTFHDDGRFTLEEGSWGITGVYAVRGDLYTEMLHGGEWYPNIPATYRWTFDGERLRFELVGEDVNSDREVGMTRQAFLLQEE